MEAAKTVDDIEILEYPLEVNYGQWAIDHPECDTIYEQIVPGRQSSCMLLHYQKRPIAYW